MILAGTMKLSVPLVLFGFLLTMTCSQNNIAGPYPKNGIIWTTRASGTMREIWFVAFLNQSFIACGDSGTILHSTDGKQWIASNMVYNGLNDWVSSISFGNGMYVAVGGMDTVGIFISKDGYSWSKENLGVEGGLNSIVWGDSQFVAAGDWAGSRGIIMTSRDGISWASNSSDSIPCISSIEWGNSRYVAAGICHYFDQNRAKFCSAIVSSQDGINWVTQRFDTGQMFFPELWADSLFIVGGTSPGLYTSPDGISWTKRENVPAETRCIVRNDTEFVLAGYILNRTSSIFCYSSYDGISWTLQRPPSDFLSSMAYGNGEIVATGTGGNILTYP
jgi:hypothetical protein